MRQPLLLPILASVAVATASAMEAAPRAGVGDGADRAEMRVLFEALQGKEEVSGGALTPEQARRDAALAIDRND